jgi:hypothetical protein
VTVPPLWPSTLPLWPGVNGFSGTKQSGKVEFQPESGPPIVRAAQTARVDVYEVTFAPLTKTQTEAFRTFYDTTLGHGSIKFGMAHPVKQVVRDAQIVGEPTETALGGGLWAVAFRLLMVDVTPSWAGDVSITDGALVDNS